MQCADESNATVYDHFGVNRPQAIITPRFGGVKKKDEPEDFAGRAPAIGAGRRRRGAIGIGGHKDVAQAHEKHKFVCNFFYKKSYVFTI